VDRLLITTTSETILYPVAEFEKNSKRKDGALYVRGVSPFFAMVESADDKPAITNRRTGYQAWYKAGKGHREGGPSQVWPDGLERWEQEGLLHRVGAPAVYGLPNGRKEWYREGMLHRTDGPAIESDAGHAFYLSGVEHTPEAYARAMDGIIAWIINPATQGIEPVFFASEKEFAAAFVETENAESAIEIKGKDGEKLRALIHGPSTGLGSEPAVCWPDGSLEYLAFGLHHRLDGPSLIVPGVNGAVIEIEETWFKNGVMHRSDGPACTTRIREKDGNNYIVHDYYEYGKKHREGGPAHVQFENKSNVPCYTEFWENGKMVETSKEAIRTVALDAKAEELVFVHVLDMEGEPRVVACDLDTLEHDLFSEGEQWYVHGGDYSKIDGMEALNGSLIVHCKDAPAVQYPDGTEEWLMNGRLHRADGPAVVNREMGITEWYSGGEKHRADGPAVMFDDGSSQWWYDNVEYSEPEFWSLIESGNAANEAALESAKKENMMEEKEIIKGETVTVTVHIKGGSLSNGDKISTMFFRSENEYIASCYKDEEGRYKIRVDGFEVDAFIHNEYGPAVEYSNNKVAYCIDGIVVESDAMKDLEAYPDDAHIIIRQEGASGLYVGNHEDLFDSHLIEDMDGRIRFRDSGKILSNRFEPAILYRDGTASYVINGKKTDASSMQMTDGLPTDFIMDPSGSLEYKGIGNLTSSRSTAIFRQEGAQKSFDIELFFQNSDFVHRFNIPFNMINENSMYINNNMYSGLSLYDSFSTKRFAKALLETLTGWGPTWLDEMGIISPVHYEAFKLRFEQSQRNWIKTHGHEDTTEDTPDDAHQATPYPLAVDNDEPTLPKVSSDQSGDIGIGSLFASVAIAGLAGVAAANKKAKKKRKAVVEKQKEVVGTAAAAVR